MIIDLFSRAIIGWKVAESLHTDIISGALNQTIRSGLVKPGAIFHSDRGCQHTAGSTRSLLARHGLHQSMSAAGYCYDNAFAESAFASLKAEILDQTLLFDTWQEARLAIFDYLETFYNRRRLHSSLGYVVPYTILNKYFQSDQSPLN